VAHAKTEDAGKLGSPHGFARPLCQGSESGRLSLKAKKERASCGLPAPFL